MKKLNVLNPKFKEDYHIHSMNFSPDAMNTVEEIVQYAGKLGMKKIAITDHAEIRDKNDKVLNKHLTRRKRILTWQNCHNDVEVIFGVEADIKNDKGELYSSIDKVEPDFIILSYHPWTPLVNHSNPTKLLQKAIEKNHKRIFALSHLHLADKKFPYTLDIDKIIELANKYKIPIEINANYLSEDKCYEKHLTAILEKADTLVFGSDSHVLISMKTFKDIITKKLHELGYTF
jgi:DNA polymerase (family X)